MREVADKLAVVKKLGYTYKQELNYPSEGYLHQSSTESFLDLKPADSGAGFRYQFSNDEYLAIYNGAEKFIAIKKDKTIMVENNPPIRSFSSSAFLYYSPLTVKNVLPKIIADKTIQKKVTVTKIAGAEHYVIEFALNKAAMDSLGEIYALKSERKSVYRLTVDKKTLLPVEFLVGNDQNQDFVKTDFVGIVENAPEPAEATWYYSTYLKDYKPKNPVELALIQAGQTAPDFKLNQFGADSQVSLGQFKGKVVLVEFWIVNCGFCIGAVPTLNSITQKFRGKDFELVSINVHDSTKAIDIFKNFHKPEYPILVEGESTGTGYGASAYPTFVLIDKNGKVIYAKPGLDDKEIEAVITENLK
jgi:thiol-disulfide isomerase/thioredoxin